MIAYIYYNYTNFLQVMNIYNGMCIDTIGNNAVGGKMGLYSCHGMGGNQVSLNSSFRQPKIFVAIKQRRMGIKMNSFIYLSKFVHKMVRDYTIIPWFLVLHLRKRHGVMAQ